MLRWSTMMILFASASSTCVADELKGSELFPLAVNKRWIYRIQGQEDRLTIVVADVEKIGDFRCFKLEGRQRAAVIATEHVSIRDDGVYRMRLDGVDFDPPLPICKFPPKGEQTWQLDYKFGDKKAAISFESDMEEVTVPLGKFKAFVVRSEIPDGNGQLKNSCWYAPKVGMVRQQIESEDGKTVLELERHDRGFEKKVLPPK